MTGGSADAAVLDAEDRFFAGLLAGDTGALRALLADDFVIVDVMRGDVVRRDPLLDVIGSGELEFLTVTRDAADASVRHRRGVAVVVGRTTMAMRFAGQEVTVNSRYTHVYVHEVQEWRLLSAQGTVLPAGD